MRLIDADALEYELGASERDIYVRDCLEDAPTIEQPQWIPVSERLPKKSGNYLVTVNVGPNTLVRTCHFLAEDGCFLALWASNPVVAWMSLPKAYEVTE